MEARSPKALLESTLLGTPKFKLPLINTRPPDGASHGDLSAGMHPFRTWRGSKAPTFASDLLRSPCPQAPPQFICAYLKTLPVLIVLDLGIQQVIHG